jgi:hypothetical protein
MTIRARGLYGTFGVAKFLSRARSATTIWLSTLSFTISIS